MPSTSEPVARLPRPRWQPLHMLLYAGFWLALGLFLAIAELQHYVRRGGTHRWEPFLWELSSAVAAGALVLLIFAGHRWLLDRRVGPGRLLLAHAGGALAYALAHSALMYGLRALVYAAADVRYEPGDAASVLAYEGAKDLVSYVLMVGLSHGVLLFLREQQQRASWQRLNQELAAAKLARLQEQLQPHFLFNALNLVSSVMYEDVARADRLLCELADLLRLTLEAGRTPTHRLSDELRLVEPFLSIMRQRFEHRLYTTVQVSEAAADCELPSLLLIAPLENAVKHGVARSAGRISVALQAEVDGGMLDIRVSDDAPSDETPGPAGHGIGLANTRERLAALYGDAASVQLAREGAATVLRLRLPARPLPAAAAAPAEASA